MFQRIGNIIKISINLSIKKANNTGSLEAIAKHCPKIEEFSTYFEQKDFIHFLSYLDILSNFSQESLVKISISGKWKYSTKAFERIFESCRKRTLNFFGIIDLNKSNNITATQNSNCGIGILYGE
ncbi:7770_t:CDS:2 [Rhizophagus irregularis]|nr:7770_t:CDS:2 [Rhizophagus irregularis]